MITLADLFWPDSALRRFATEPEMNPLTEDGALAEAQLLDVHFDAVRSTVGLLFEMRVALQLRAANTGVLIARGVRELSWSTGDRSSAPQFAWVVAGSAIGTATRLFELRLTGVRPGAGLSLVSESAAFYAGDVPGLDRMPDYTKDDEATVRAQVAGWHSEFTPLQAVFLDPAPSVS